MSHKFFGAALLVFYAGLSGFGAHTAFGINNVTLPVTVQPGETAADTSNNAGTDGDENPPAPADPGKWLKKGDYDFAYDAYSSGHFKTAFQNAMPRAQAGDIYAQTLIAILYMEGRNVPLSPQKAVYWYGRAAKGGDPTAQLRYGIDIFNGLHGIRDQQQGEAYIRRAVQAGVPQAYFYYGQIMMDNAPADERPDIGLEWFLRGAALGDSSAAYAAAKILAEGTAKIARNDSQARLLLEAAANSDSVAAQIELAGFLVEGRGGAKDKEQAFDLMKMVAVAGVPPAQVTLARYYQQGIGTKADIVKAAAWYMAAKKANYPSDDLEDMMAKLTPQQIKQARQASNHLLEAP
ncbi:MAG: sel1 repeat family protein [Candidatus Tokpelaia sp.]|nr:MAG: sel1 repeat family protein [Candidatus Tokpelaia sp.]KAA6206328.1 MAG: sel1 repeat family protein [Candidatus Tokpelaia sp.]